MSLKQRIKILLYDFVKVCPPARRLVRHMLFKYREVTFRHHTKGIPTDPNLMVFCTFSGRGYSDSPRAIFEYLASRPEASRQYRYVWIFGAVPVAGGAVSKHDGAPVGQRALSEGHGGGKILGV